MEHKECKNENGIIHYWINKKENSKCIVFTHGVTADHSMFEPQEEYFSDKYTIITWDVPMHGLSKEYKEFSYKNCAKDLYDILKQENIEKVILVGMSMGGYPSQEFINDYPDMVEKFIALDTTPFGLSYYSKFDIWCLKNVKPIAKLFTEKILKWSMVKSISETKAGYELMKKILKKSTKEEIIEQMDIAYSKFILENREISIKCPVLILLGDKDSTGKVKQYSEQWAKNTNYPLHIIKNAKHFSNVDNAKQVNNEIEEFINM